ncbi:MAG: bifunctional nuclease family protein [Bacteroidales bacterium]|nr:bifunctional nuclease family protein [Bacteroidales bacterium]
MEKVKLRVAGISYSDIYTGAYALILEEENGGKRLPIVIGAFEAQSIAIQIEKIKPPRPITHDLFVSVASAYKIELKEVNIYKLEEGIFYANLILRQNDNEVVIDSRTSDAVALAIRFNCPIYTTQEIMDKAGIYMSFEGEEKEGTQQKEKSNKIKKHEAEKERSERKNPFAKYSLEELERMLKKAVENEDYEKASAIRDEINRRKKE